MTHKEFSFWIKGIVDSTEFMPTKKTWDIIVDKVKLLEGDEIPLHYSPQPLIPIPDTTEKNPYEHIICDAKEEPKGSAHPGKLNETDMDNVFKNEIK